MPLLLVARLRSRMNLIKGRQGKLDDTSLGAELAPRCGDEWGKGDKIQPAK